ncbi:TPA: hypothetical protein ACJGT4_002102 [Salmonella enterica subsp. enterica]
MNELVKSFLNEKIVEHRQMYHALNKAAETELEIIRSLKSVCEELSNGD